MQKGFTLIELLGIITILGLILIVAIPMLIESNRVAKTNERNYYNSRTDTYCCYSNAN